jgi:hypothetical protein
MSWSASRREHTPLLAMNRLRRSFPDGKSPNAGEPSRWDLDIERPDAADGLLDFFRTPPSAEGFLKNGLGSFFLAEIEGDADRELFLLDLLLPPWPDGDLAVRIRFF